MKEENNLINKSKENNINDNSDISQDNTKIDLLNKLKDIHCKSEERTFDLNEKFNHIKDDLQKLIDKYKNNLYEEDEYDNNIDIFSLHKYINNYISNEREISINNINNVFEQVIDTINTKKDNNSEQKENIKNSLIEVKNKYDTDVEETMNHFEEAKNQKDEIREKIDIQMEEQFEKVNEALNDEIEIGEKNKNDIINATQSYLMDLGKKMKKVKIDR